MKPTKLFPAEHAREVYYHTPEYGKTLDDVLKPDYWTHVTKYLRVGYRIEILAADQSFWAMLLVRAVGRHDAIVDALFKADLGEPEAVETEDSPYKVMWRGPARKFSVVRISDNEVIRDEFPVKEQAIQWMQNHMKSLAA